MASITREIPIAGMHCENCKKRVTEALGALDGVNGVSVDWKRGRATVTFDDGKTGLLQIADTLDAIGYHSTAVDGVDLSAGKETERSRTTFAGAAFAALGIGVVIYLLMKLSGSVSVPDISPTMGLGLLFVVGLLTGFHCVGMCGGFVVGYTAKAAARRQHPVLSHLQYGVGKLASYTIIGAGFGLLGSFITFTPFMRGMVGILAGMFLLLYGLSMLGVFSWTKRIRIASPAFLNRFIDRHANGSRGPLVIGLLNGLMIACGPLQAIYVMAAGTGSALEGAQSLFVFGAGTLPVMLGFGLAASTISVRATRKILVASGIVVVALGVIMINRGLVLSGAGGSVSSFLNPGAAPGDAIAGTVVEMRDGYQVIRMDVTRYGWEPDRFVLAVGVPVKWIITGREINSCNNAIVVPEYGLRFPVKAGEQVIEFTPREKGVVSWSCWMGMIPGTFVVRDAGDVAERDPIAPVSDAPAISRGPTCGMAGSVGDGCCGGPTGR